MVVYFAKGDLGQPFPEPIRRLEFAQSLEHLQ
jgi:hypothetical protein